MKRISFLARSCLLGIILVAGLVQAGPPQVKTATDQIKPAVDKEPQFQQDQKVDGNGNLKSGEVSSLPLEGLKARKFKTPDGKEGWSVTIPGNRPLATPAVVDGMVYLGGGFGSYEFYAFEAESGKPKWAIRVNDDGPTAAVAAKGVVAFNTESCTLFVVDGKSGRMLWSKWLGDPLMSQPAISEDKLLMAFPGGKGHQLIALGLRDGKEFWRADLEGDIISAPVVHNDSVYLSTFNGTVYRFRITDGKPLWQKDMNATSAPWLYQDQVFVSRREKGADQKPVEGISRLETKKGENNQAGGIWHKRTAPYLDAEVQRGSGYYSDQKANDSSVGFATGPATAKLEEASANVGQGTVNGLWEFQGSRPCVFKNKLFLTQGDKVVALNPDTGKEIWTRDLAGDLEKIGGHLAAPPVPAGNKLYLVTATGEVLILSQDRGTVLDTIKIGSQMRFQPSLAKGMLFVGTADGKLIGINLKDPSADGWTMWGGGPSHNGA